MRQKEEFLQNEEKIHHIPLDQLFEGDTLLNLEELGVETFDAAEVEKDIIEQARKFQVCLDLKILAYYA